MAGSRATSPSGSGTFLIPREAPALIAIKVDGVVRTHRGFRETAIEAARFLQQRHPGIIDQRDGSTVPLNRK